MALLPTLLPTAETKGMHHADAKRDTKETSKEETDDEETIQGLPAAIARDWPMDQKDSPEDDLLRH